MQRKIFFCKSWFAAKKRPTEVWNEEQARKAHAMKQPYTVLVDSMEAPYCTITMTAQFAGVDFLDDLLRSILTYHFQDVGSERLFITMATYREFNGKSDRVAAGTTYMFAQDGTVRMRRESFRPLYKLETASSKADVAPNYSPAPVFGEYSDLIRSDRDAR